MDRSARGRWALLASSVTLFRELLGEESIDCEWEERGCLQVYATEEGLEHHAENLELVNGDAGPPPKRLDADALLELEPAIKPGTAAGAWYDEEDAHLNPGKLLSEWRRVLESLGVEIREACAAKGFSRSNGTARAVRVAGGESLAADAVVVATGAWTPLLNRELGCRIPIQPGKGYSITMPRPARCPGIPMIFQDEKVAVTPMRSVYRLGSTMEFAGYDETLNRRRLKGLVAGAVKYLHEPTAEPVEEQWYGWRPMTHDGLPIIDRSPALDNVFIAAGHNMIGLTLAPITGKLVAEMVIGQAPHVDIRPYAVTRT